MVKIGTSDGTLVYGKGLSFAKWFGALIPLGWGLIYYLQGPVEHYAVVTLLGLGGFAMGAFQERMVLDVKSRVIHRTKSFLGRTTHAESIAFDAVNGISVKRHFERSERSAPTTPPRWSGAFQLVLQWEASGRQGGVTVVFDIEQDARAEAEILATLFGVEAI